MNGTVAGLTEKQWIALAKRVGRGQSTAADADPVEEIGLLPQAIKIRNGTATHGDAILINIQAGMKLLDQVEKSGTGQKRVAV